MNEQRYNGWTNYETWNVALWIDNEEPSYRYWRSEAKGILEGYMDGAANAPGDQDNAKETAARVLAQKLKEEIEDGNPLSSQSSLYSDILTTALSEVNWDEIASNWIDEVYEPPQAEEEEEAEKTS